jgi:hypothetical protein
MNAQTIRSAPTVGGKTETKAAAPALKIKSSKALSIRVIGPCPTIVE